ncbi:hypothetical protein MNBD_ALPHA02-2561 [hydrothermal vent metagenome]|uniref:Heme exporter protein D n=1 Tax=hydrothermal vent metagenome TaxID=652676 RepID=A0A3B0RFD0_9ZZZZ
MEGNEVFLLFSYIASAVILVALFVTSLWTKKKDEAVLRKLQDQIRDLTDRQGKK